MSEIERLKDIGYVIVSVDDEGTVTLEKREGDTVTTRRVTEFWPYRYLAAASPSF